MSQDEMGEDEICAACGEPIDAQPGESFMASVDGRVWHMGCSPRLNPNQSEQAMNAEITEALHKAALDFRNAVHSGQDAETIDRCDRFLLIAADEARDAIEALSANTVAPEGQVTRALKLFAESAVMDEHTHRVTVDEWVLSNARAALATTGAPDGGEMIACLGSAVEARPFLNADAYRAPDTVAPDDAEYLLSLVGFLQAHHVNTERLERIAALGTEQAPDAVAPDARCSKRGPGGSICYGTISGGACSRCGAAASPDPSGIVVMDDDAELMAEALRAVKAYYFGAEPCGHTEAYVCDLVCQALERHAK